MPGSVYDVIGDDGYFVDGKTIGFARYITIQLVEAKTHCYFLGQKRQREVSLAEAMDDWGSENSKAQMGNHVLDKNHAERVHNSYEANKVGVNKLCDSYCGEGNCSCRKENGSFEKDPAGRCPYLSSTENLKKLHMALHDDWEGMYEDP